MVAKNDRDVVLERDLPIGILLDGHVKAGKEGEKRESKEQSVPVL